MLQDIDQMSLFTTVVKWSKAVRRVRDLAPTLEEAFLQAQQGLPGPVFVECPVDLLYDEAMVRASSTAWRVKARRWGQSGQRLSGPHVNRLFAGAEAQQTAGPAIRVAPPASPHQVRQAAERLRRAQRPLLIVGSQATLDPAAAGEVGGGLLERIGAP